MGLFILICINYFLVEYFFLMFEKNFLISAAPTPKEIANIIENNP